MKALRSHPLPVALLGGYLAIMAATYTLMVMAWLTPGYERTGQESWWFSTWPLLFLAYPVVGALVAARQPRNAVGWLFCALGMLWALVLFATAYAGYGLKARPGALAGAEAVNWFQSWAFFPALGLILIYVPLLFPNSRPLRPPWRLVGWTGAVGIGLVALTFAFAPGALDDGIGGFPNPYGILPESLVMSFALLGFPLTFASAVAASMSMVLRLRQARGPEREQLKWITFATAIVAGAFLGHLALQLSSLAERVWWYGIPWGMALCGIPVAAGIAILRQGLFDIDLVINRTLVYSALTLFVASGYVLLVAGAGVLFRTEGGVVSLVAAGVVAVAFQPLRDRVQRTVNRLLYGERDDPYAVLSRLGQRLESALLPEEILPTIVRTMQETLRLPYVAIVLDAGAARVPAVSAGSPVAGVLHLPLVYQQAPMGELLVAPAAPARHSARRTAGSWRTWRARSVLPPMPCNSPPSATLPPTHRLRPGGRATATAPKLRGLGAQLAALAMQAGALRTMIADDPAAAAYAAELRSELRSAVSDIRRLVHGLRPPALDELGLVGALRQRASQYETGGFAETAAGVGNNDSHLAISVVSSGGHAAVAGRGRGRCLSYRGGGDRQRRDARRRS
ncbi:MAG: histidine kinase [Thermomicrobiales bacterium]